MKTHCPRLLAMLLLFALSCVASPGGVTTNYVRYGGAGLQDGSSWSNAFAEIQQAINALSLGSEINETVDGTIKVGLTTSTQSYAKANFIGNIQNPTTVRIEGGYDAATDMQVGMSTIRGNGVTNTDVGIYLYKTTGDHGEFLRIDKADRLVIKDVQIGIKIKAGVSLDQVRPNIRLYNSTVTAGQHGLQVDWPKNYLHGPTYITVADSTITAGQDLGAADGDAIWCHSAQPRVSVVSSELTSGVGGGMYIVNENAGDATAGERFYVYVTDSRIVDTAGEGIHYEDPNSGGYGRGVVGVRLIGSVITGHGSNGVYVKTWNEGDWTGGNDTGEIHFFATNSVIADNAGYGVDLYGYSATRPDCCQVEFQMVNCTVADNTAGGIRTRTAHNTFGTHIVYNTIIAGNGGNGVNVDDGNSTAVNVTEDYNDFYDNTGPELLEAGVPGTLGANDLEADPAFVGTGDHPYRPDTGSVVLNAGNDAVAPALDILDVARPSGAHVSMGAYETGPSPTVMMIR